MDRNTDFQRMSAGRRWRSVAMSVCLVAICTCQAFAATSDTVSARIDNLTPDIPTVFELRPGQLRLIGCDVPDGIKTGVSQASSFTVTLYLECLPELSLPFKREILFTLAETDIGRIPFELADVQPGEVVKIRVDLRVPRNASTGKSVVKTGFVRDGAYGESRDNLSDLMVPLFSLDVNPASPVQDISTKEKQVFLQTWSKKQGRSLIKNGGYELGLARWTVADHVIEREDGWEKILGVSIDRHVGLEGKRSLRVDFGGGQDPNFYHIKQCTGVKPGTKYMLSYCMKTEAVTSSAGPSLSVEDPEKTPEQFFATAKMEERLTGTNDWTYIEIEFEIPHDTRSVCVRVRRFGSGPHRYDRTKYGPIGGSVWYDAIQLVER